MLTVLPPTPVPALVSEVSSWDELVTAYGPGVFRVAYRLTGNRADAEDLTQEAFVRAFRSLDTYRPGSLSGWLHRITTNLFLDQVRRRPAMYVDRLGPEIEQLPSPRPAPEDLVLEAFDEDVLAALRALNPEARAAVVLRDIEGLSYAEVADLLGLKIGTVRSRIHRGRAQLRRALSHRAPLPRGVLRGRGIEIPRLMPQHL